MNETTITIFIALLIIILLFFKGSKRDTKRDKQRADTINSGLKSVGKRTEEVEQLINRNDKLSEQVTDSNKRTKDRIKSARSRVSRIKELIKEARQQESI
ncbi:MAG: hypothetical protein GY787_19025 [Alteromonadales bacterium]|nr:hypothetical protein [Alteromonadales bacterium]